MYLEVVKTDCLTLDGVVNSFTLTPIKDNNGTNKIRADKATEYIRTRTHRNKMIGSHIIYNFNDCHMEITSTPPPTRKVILR
ncbi:hypothetical protein [Thalassobacillus devorans]|uniref:hypothetical protein n=1 Tax=Thalassobacillus devorans TaxID=279813 RepID=UPI000A1C9B48|nr:hypothetical protein [Thalassobacillus devorans]